LAKHAAALYISAIIFKLNGHLLYGSTSCPAQNLLVNGTYLLHCQYLFILFDFYFFGKLSKPVLRIVAMLQNYIF